MSRELLPDEDERSLPDERSLLDEPLLLLPERFCPSAWSFVDALRDPLWPLDDEPLIPL